MIDHGFAFNGPHWEFQDSHLQGLYFRTAVYDEVRSLDSFQPWIAMVENFPLEVVDSAWKEIPRDWLQDDEAPLEDLLEKLLKRRSRIAALIHEISAQSRYCFRKLAVISLAIRSAVNGASRMPFR